MEDERLQLMEGGGGWQRRRERRVPERNTCMLMVPAARPLLGLQPIMFR